MPFRRGGQALLLAALLPLAAIAATPSSREPAPAGGNRTFYLSPHGRDSASGQATAPWASFAKAWSMLEGGDRLVLADGSYPDASPPTGKEGSPISPITIAAANPGGARLAHLELKGNAYLAFMGLRIDATEGAVSIGSAGPGKPSHHITFQQLGFSCTPGTLNDGACFGIGDGSHHVLLEDSWGWGGARYTVLCYGGPGGHPHNLTCDHNTLRRVVLRMGPAKSSGGNPQAALSLYYASANLVENVIAVDGRAASDSSNAAFYMTGHEPPPNSDANRYLGVIALNNLGTGLYVDCPGAVCNRTEVRNSVFWSASQGAIAIAGGTGPRDACDATTIDHNTAGGAKQGGGYENYACRNATLTNNALLNNRTHGAKQSGTAGSTTVNSHNGYSGNGGRARENLSSGTGDLTSNPGLTYLVRIETSSPYHNAGTTGDIGANVVARYRDGVLTQVPLWPWPFEERLRREMCAESTGEFCASGKTLTRYIWEYLGHPIPAAIYSQAPPEGAAQATTPRPK